MNFDDAEKACQDELKDEPAFIGSLARISNSRDQGKTLHLMFPNSIRKNKFWASLRQMNGWSGRIRRLEVYTLGFLIHHSSFLGNGTSFGSCYSGKNQRHVSPWPVDEAVPKKES